VVIVTVDKRQESLASYSGIGVKLFLFGLKNIYVFPVAIKNLRNIPALQAGIGVYLRTVVHLMLQHHH